MIERRYSYAIFFRGNLYCFNVPSLDDYLDAVLTVRVIWAVGLILFALNAGLSLP